MDHITKYRTPYLRVVKCLYFLLFLLTDPFNPGEAIHLARDFGYVCETEFPARQVSFQTQQYLAKKKLQ